jgi:hypothetical protein
MFITYFIIKDTARFEFIPQGQTVNKDCRVEMLNLCIQKGLNFGPTIEFSTTTVLRLAKSSLSSSFWPIGRLVKWNIHPVSMIWLRMTSGYFQK